MGAKGLREAGLEARSPYCFPGKRGLSLDLYWVKNWVLRLDCHWEMGWVLERG